VGNRLVYLSFIVDPRIRNPSNALLVSSSSFFVILLCHVMSITDFFVGLVTYPELIVEELTSNPILRRTSCLLWLNIVFALNIVSSNHLICISLDRYQILFEGVPYLQRRSMTNTVFTPVIFVWLVALWIITPNIVNPDSAYMYSYEGNYCQQIPTSSFMFIFNLALIMFPGCIIVAMYRGIYTKLRTGQWRKVQANEQDDGISITTPSEDRVVDIGTHQKNYPATSNAKESRKKKQKDAAKMLGILIALFWICWTPNLILSTLGAFNITFSSESIYRISVFMGNLNSLFNPCVYARRNQDFRSALKSLWRKTKGICLRDVV